MNSRKSAPVVTPGNIRFQIVCPYTRKDEGTATPLNFRFNFGLNGMQIQICQFWNGQNKRTDSLEFEFLCRLNCMDPGKDSGPEKKKLDWTNKGPRTEAIWLRENLQLNFPPIALAHFRIPILEG